jgi:tetratricopeptide (TPR) repeat protein
VLRREPADPDGIALEGALDALAGDYAKAAPLLESARKANPSSPVANFYLGVVWQATGQTDRARQAFGDCVQENDKFVAAYVHLGQIALESRDARLGASYARKILTVDSGSLDGYLLLAQADMMSGDLRAAGRILAAGEKLPHAPLPLVEVGLRYEVLRGNFTAADTAFRRALAGTSDPARLAASYAAALSAKGQTIRAIRTVEAALAVRPHDAPLHLLLARLDDRAGRLRRAQREAHLAISSPAAEGLARDLLGEIDEQEGHAKDAAAEYAAAIRARPHDPSGYLLAGDLLMRQDRYREADREFSAARIVSPGSDPVKLALAYCWAQLGANLDQALGLAQQLKSRYPENPEVADTLGWIYFRKGIYPLAVEQLQFAARRAPANAVIEFHLGVALVADGDAAAGKAALLRALWLHLPARESSAARAALGESRQAANR